MKKVYMMPLAEVVKTGAEEMICSSGLTVDGVIDDAGIWPGDSPIEADGKGDFENVFENLW